MKPLILTIALISILPIVSCSEQETMYSKCFNKEFTQVPDSEFVSILYDKELAEKFAPDLFVDSVEEQKRYHRAVWQAYRDYPNDKNFRRKVDVFGSEEREENFNYIYRKEFELEFLKKELPEMYEAFINSYYYKRGYSFRKVTLSDLHASIVVTEEDKAWIDAGLPDVPDWKLTSAQFDKIPFEEWYQQDLEGFEKLKNYLQPLIKDDRENVQLANQIRKKFAEKICNERGLYE